MKSFLEPFKERVASRVGRAFIIGFTSAVLCVFHPLAANAVAENKYLLFQLFTFAQGNNENEHAFPPQGEIKQFVHDIINRIGTTGSAAHKLGFAVGPLALSQSDEEVRELIRESFEIARKNNVAVAFHIDDQMFWASHPILRAHKSEVVEWIDWQKTPCTARRLDWGPEPARVSPSLCLNHPFVVDAVRKRSALIGSEIKREIAGLKAAGKEDLFAGVISGWESRIGNDFDSGKLVGYHSLVNNGFSSKLSSSQREQELSRILKQFMELWASSLEQAGVPVEKMYSHIAFTGQGLADDTNAKSHSDANAKNHSDANAKNHSDANAKNHSNSNAKNHSDSNVKNDSGPSFAERFGYAVPDVAFGKYYRPGFSTYPLDDTIEQVRAEVSKRGGGAWISAEGTNVVPNQVPGESGMETYLAKMFNHNAVIVNIFSWGIGGEAHKDNFFRRATEGDEALAAYRKFLSGQSLKEIARSNGQFSPAKLRRKLDQIQVALPAWVQRTRRPDLVQGMMEKLDGYIKAGKILDADAQADQILKVLNSNP